MSTNISPAAKPRVNLQNKKSQENAPKAAPRSSNNLGQRGFERYSTFQQAMAGLQQAGLNTQQVDKGGYSTAPQQKQGAATGADMAL